MFYVHLKMQKHFHSILNHREQWTVVHATCSIITAVTTWGFCSGKYVIGALSLSLSLSLSHIYMCVCVYIYINPILLATTKLKAFPSLVALFNTSLNSHLPICPCEILEADIYRYPDLGRSKL
jgi:hypothetical protein